MVMILMIMVVVMVMMVIIILMKIIVMMIEVFKSSVYRARLSVRLSANVTLPVAYVYRSSKEIVFMFRMHIS